MPRHGSERTDNQSRSINYNSMKPTVRARSRQRILGLPRGCWARAILPQPSLPGTKPTPVAWLAGDIWPRNNYPGPNAGGSFAPFGPCPQDVGLSCNLRHDGRPRARQRTATNGRVKQRMPDFPQRPAVRHADSAACSRTIEPIAKPMSTFAGHLLVFDPVQAPPLRHAFEPVNAAILEADSRLRHQVLDGA
jgi:hypothetical protein